MEGVLTPWTTKLEIIKKDVRVGGYKSERFATKYFIQDTNGNLSGGAKPLSFSTEDEAISHLRSVVYNHNQKFVVKLDVTVKTLEGKIIPIPEPN